MKRFLSLFMALAVLAFVASPALAAKPNTTGFDEFGYNDTARVFVGPADGVDETLDGMVWGDSTYANDHLVMKWNAQWDNCNASDTLDTCLGAWTDNEWNGNVPGGSGVTEHYKIIWVGPGDEASPYWVAGGYSVWGNYEVVMDQGTDTSGHFWFAHGIPNGYGAVK